MSKTYIAGKDCALEDTLAAIESGLAALGIQPKITQTANPVEQVWSVHLMEPETGLYTNGKGTCLMAALVSAWAEFCERLGTGYFFAPLFLGSQLAGELRQSFVFDKSEKWLKKSEEILNPELWTLYDPEKSFRKALKKDPGLLRVLSDAHTGTGLKVDFSEVLCLPFQPIDGGDQVWFPLNMVWNLYASNGLSAGNTKLEARIQGLSEIMERYVKFRVIAESLCLPNIPSTYWSPKANLAIHGIEAAGFRLVVKDASLGGIFPVVVVALIHPQSAEVLLSFGSHPDFSVALERTVTELFQGRPLMHSEEFSAPIHDGILLADAGNLENHFINSTGLVPERFFSSEVDFPFTPWPLPVDRIAEMAGLVRILDGLGKKAYVREKPCAGVQSCQILVPGLSEIYPMEEAWLANTSRFQALRAFLVKGPALDEATLQECLDIVETEFLGTPGSQLVADLVGIDLAGSSWDGLTSTELSALVYLALSDHEQLGQYLIYEMDWSSVSKNRRSFWRCLSHILEKGEMPATDLHDALQRDAAQACLTGRWPHAIFPPLGLDFAQAPAQLKLLKLYRAYHLL